MWRLFGLVVALAVGVALPFAVWGGDLEAWIGGEGAVQMLRAQGDRAWMVGVGLIIADIALPIPSTAVMAALGLIYGPVLGGLLAASGSTAAGLAGYGVCRALGPRLGERIAGMDGMERARVLFERWGGWIVAASRWLPVLPETISFLAGLTAMPFRRYLAALVCGAAPLGFTFATAGHLGAEAPILTVVLAAIAPLLLWALARPFLARQPGDQSPNI